MMPAPSPPHGTARQVDTRAMARAVRRMRQAPAEPWLHGEVARRMAERLAVVRQQPQQVLDWGLAHLGGARGADASRTLLAQAYPKARLLAVDEPEAASGAADAAPAASSSRPWWARLLPGTRPEPALAPQQLSPGMAQLVWSNMWLHHQPDPQAAMRQWQRALQVDGFLMFSTLGPGSLDGLRGLYAEEGWAPPHAAFVDMHDLGDMLVEAGFADPVMDQETLTLTWPSPEALLAELRGLGANSHPQRFAGLRTPRWRSRLAQALQARSAPDGRIALGFEIVYGHAFRAAPRAPVQSETQVGLDDMRAILRAGRGKP